jgi:hypothetical protein
MIHIPHGLSRFPKGAPVVTEKYFNRSGGTITMVGHVEGFSINNTGEVILKIQWATGEVGSMHTAHVNLI